MKHKIILDSKRYVRGTISNMSVGESLIFTKALRTLYNNKDTDPRDKKTIKKMLADIEREKQRCLKLKE